LVAGADAPQVIRVMRITTSAGLPVLRWPIPELEAGSQPLPAPTPAGGPDEDAADISPQSAPQEVESDERPADEIIERQIASGYAEGWERGHAEGREQGYAAGIAAGTEAAQAAHAEAMRRLAAITAKLGAPIAALDAAVEEAVAALALEVAREVIGSETSSSREYLVHLIRRAVAKVPVEMGSVKIVLNPADLELIRGLAPDIESESASLIGDDGIEPGDCLVVADGQNTAIKDMRWRPRAGDAQADLSLAARWRAVMRTLFEEEDK
jgi:flagellar assembly protein FliH